MGRPVQLCYRRKSINSILVLLTTLVRMLVDACARAPCSTSAKYERGKKPHGFNGVVVEVVKAPSHVHMRPLRCGAVLSARQNPHGVCAVRLGGLVAFVHSPHMRIASG